MGAGLDRVDGRREKMAETFQYDVFLSHSLKDKKVALS